MVSRSRRSTSSALASLLIALALFATACGGGSDDASGGDSGTDDAGADASDGDGENAGEDADGDLTAPTDTVAPDDGADDGEAQFGGTLRVAVEAEADGLNPAQDRFSNAAYVMLSGVMDNLVYADPNGDWFPFLAESFTPSDDFLTWTMTLRDGVTFHDGTTLDSEDVVASFMGQFTNPTVSLALAYRFDPETPIEALDALTVQYNLSRPEARFPASMFSQLGMVVPAEFVAASLDDPSLNQNPPGTGPFMISERTQDEVTVLTRFDDYWAADLHDIYLDEIHLFPITDPVIAAERVAAGDLDIAVSSNTEAILTLRESGVPTIENSRAGEDFAMLNTSKAPFDDIRVRQAITHATPRDAYVDLIRQGVSPVANTMFHPDLVFHNPDVVQQSDMPELAGPLIEAYCADVPDSCTDGKVNIELQYSGPSVLQTRIAELLVSAWDPFFNVTQDEKLQDVHIQEAVFGAFDVITWRQFGEPSPQSDTLWIDCRSVGPLSLNFPRYCDEERNVLIDELVASNDSDRIIEIWKEIQVMMNESYSYIFFNHATWTIGHGANVHGVCGQMSPDGVELFCNNQGRIRLRQIWMS